MQKPGGPPGKKGKGRKVDIHVLVHEDTFSFLKDDAEAHGRWQNQHAGLILDGFFHVKRRATRAQRERFDQLVRDPDALYRVLLGGLGSETE